MSNRRRTRVSTGKEATVSWAGGECRGILRDVSLKGAYVRLANGLRPGLGEEVTLVIHLDPGASEADIRVRARTVRTEPEGVALDFVEVPADTFPHLFRLVQYNAPRPEQIEGEISDPAFDLGD